MTQHVPMPIPVKKEAGFWTPWGSLRVPDLDKALDSRPKRPIERPAKARINEVKLAARDPRR